MKIQSLSVVVPNPACINSCPFCVSRMNADTTYKNQMNDNLPFFDLYLKDYIKRLEFARDNGCNTVMLTGNTEPQQNRKFLTYFGMFMQLMKNPFHWIEMQTTGVLLDQNYLRFLRNHVGVNLISLSLSALDSKVNGDIISSNAPMPDIPFLCSEIKRYDFSLRLSLNLTDYYDRVYVRAGDSPDEQIAGVGRIFEDCRKLGADQVTIRILYSSDTGTPQDEWIKEHAASENVVHLIESYVKANGIVLGVLPHGAVKYSLDGLCVVIDEDCMDKSEKTGEDYKYLVLQPDCKLYSQWDDKSSLIF